MTALCSGGTSQPKPTTPAVVAFTATAVDALLADAGVPWLIPFATSLAFNLTDTAGFCASDPPSIPSFTPAELASLLPGIQNSDTPGASLKVRDLLFHLAWYALCDCNAAAPTPLPSPALPPVDGAPIVIGAKSGVCVTLRPTEARVLNLWNGTTNVSPPSGWDAVGFNDSGWASAVSPDTSSGSYISPFQTNASGASCDSFDACRPEPTAPWSRPTGKEQFLIRWRFNLPDFDPAQLCVTLYGAEEVGVGNGAWSTGLSTINGGTQFTDHSGLSMRAHLADLHPGPNLWAAHVNPGAGATPSIPLWGTYGWIGITLFQPGVLGGNGTGCCPDVDPRLLDQLRQILTLVTLTQRQLAPFAYVYGTSWGPVGDVGEISVQGLLGVQISPTNIPDDAGVVAGNPDELWLESWVCWGNADGWAERQWLRHSPQLSFPPLAGQFTRLGYSIRPGMGITIREIIREP